MPAVSANTSPYNQDAVVQAYNTASGGGGLAAESAAANLAAEPSLEALSQMVNEINRQARLAQTPGGAELDRRAVENIGNELAGYVPQSFMQNLQTSLAQQGVGFGVDSPRLNAAALRGMGLESLDIVKQGMADWRARAAADAANMWDVSQGMITPALLEQQQYHKGQLAAEAAARADATARWQAELAARQNEASAAAAAQLRIAEMQQETARAELAERQREYDITGNRQVLQQINELTERAYEAGINVQLATQQLNAQIYQTNLQYMQPTVAQLTAQFTNALPNYVTFNNPGFTYTRTI